MTKIAALVVVFLVAFVPVYLYSAQNFGWFGGPGLCGESGPCSQAITHRPDMGQAVYYATVVGLVCLAVAAGVTRWLWRDEPQ